MADVLKLSQQEKEALADEYNDKKIIFEAALSSALLKIFRLMARDFTAIYSATGAIQDFSIYLSDIEVALKISYRRSSTYFSNHFTRELSKQDPQNEDEQELLLLLISLRGAATFEITKKLIAFVNSQPAKQAEFILETTQKIFVDAVDEVIAELALEGLEATDAEIAKKATKIAAEKNKNRAGGISETETGISSGTGSQVEATEFEKEIVKAKLDSTLKKNWLSRLDKSVRLSHLIAHSQKKDVDEPFIVQGQKLMFPTDTTLGASLSNIIRCRCISLYS